MNPNNPLEQLRDIHLPEAVSWWPPAPSWWLLLLLLIAAAFILRWRYKQRQRKRFSKEALQELHAIEQAFNANQNTQQLAQNISALLRRVCITLHPRREAAAITGNAWLILLDQQLPTTEFSEKFRTALLTAPYQAQPQIDVPALLSLCKRWINALPPRPEPVLQHD